MKDLGIFRLYPRKRIRCPCQKSLLAKSTCGCSLCAAMLLPPETNLPGNQRDLVARKLTRFFTGTVCPQSLCDSLAINCQSQGILFCRQVFQLILDGADASRIGRLCLPKLLKLAMAPLNLLSHSLLAGNQRLAIHSTPHAFCAMCAIGALLLRIFFGVLFNLLIGGFYKIIIKVTRRAGPIEHEGQSHAEEVENNQRPHHNSHVHRIDRGRDGGCNNRHHYNGMSPEAHQFLPCNQTGACQEGHDQGCLKGHTHPKSKPGDKTDVAFNRPVLTNDGAQEALQEIDRGRDQESKRQSPRRERRGA